MRIDFLQKLLNSSSNCRIFVWNNLSSLLFINVAQLTSFCYKNTDKKISDKKISDKKPVKMVILCFIVEKRKSIPPKNWLVDFLFYIICLSFLQICFYRIPLAHLLDICLKSIHRRNDIWNSLQDYELHLRIDMLMNPLQLL